MNEFLMQSTDKTENTPLDECNQVPRIRVGSITDERNLFYEKIEAEYNTLIPFQSHENSSYLTPVSSNQLLSRFTVTPALGLSIQIIIIENQGVMMIYISSKILPKSGAKNFSISSYLRELSLFP